MESVLDGQRQVYKKVLKSLSGVEKLHRLAKTVTLEVVNGNYPNAGMAVRGLKSCLKEAEVATAKFPSTVGI